MRTEFISHSHARSVHDDRHTHEANGSPDDIESVWARTVYSPSPEERQYNEHAAIGGIDSTKVARLIGRNDAIENKNGRSGNPIAKWPSLTKTEDWKLSTVCPDRYWVGLESGRLDRAILGAS